MDPPMFKRIGELLVSYGELTTADLSMIHAEQKRYYRPFGTIAAEMFGVDAATILPGLASVPERGDPEPTPTI